MEQTGQDCEPAGGAPGQEDAGTAGAPDGAGRDAPGPATGEQAEGYVEAALLKEKQRSAYYEDRFKRALADFQNMERKTRQYVEAEVNRRLDRFLVDILDVFDDFERARDSYGSGGADTSGLDSVIRNMNALLARHDVRPVQAVGKKFDPHLHEAVSFSSDGSVEEDTVTREIRRGYVANDRLIRPTLVVVSKISD